MRGLLCIIFFFLQVRRPSLCCTTSSMRPQKSRPSGLPTATNLSTESPLTTAASPTITKSLSHRSEVHSSQQKGRILRSQRPRGLHIHPLYQSELPLKIFQKFFSAWHGSISFFSVKFYSHEQNICLLLFMMNKEINRLEVILIITKFLIKSFS